jgi:hypothetical protein
MKDTLGKEFYESADKTIKVTKQETLEEVAEKYASYNNDYVKFADGEHDFNEGYKNAFINGAKWQQKKYNKQHKSPTT